MRAPTPPAMAPEPRRDPEHGLLLAEEYLPDGTYVERYEDGTEYHYPPADAAGGAPADANGAGQYNYYAQAAPGEAGVNPIGQEFYGYHQHYQQQQQQQAAGQVDTPMARGSIPPAPPLGGPAPSETALVPAGGENKKKRHDKDEPNANGEGPRISDTEAVPVSDLPTSGFWIVDCFSEAFFSLAFKCWASLLFLNTFMIYFFYGLDFLFATQYRFIAPPAFTSGSLFWQTMAFGCLFLALSFFIVTMLRMLIDVIREIFTAQKTDNCLFGVSLSSSHPPYVFHVVLVNLLTVVPLLWSIIVTASTARTFAYFVQFFLFASTILTMFMAFVIYGVLWVNSFRMKTMAYNQREEEKRLARDFKRKKVRRDEDDDDDAHEMEDEESEESSESEEDEGGNGDAAAGKKKRRRRHRRRRATRRRHTTTISQSGRTMAASWYDSELTLQEFGLNTKTVRWMILVFFFGWLPVQVVTITFAFEGVSPSWDVYWIVVGVIIIFTFIGLTEGNTRFSNRVGTFINLLVIITFMCFGVLSTAISGNSVLVGVFIVLLILTHGMMLRKRPYEMLSHEIEATFGPSLDVVGDGDPVDTYLCLCRNTVLEFMRCGDCLDVYGVFGKKNPKVAALEKQYRKENLTLMTDMRLLMYYWIILWIAMAGAVGLAPTLSPVYAGINPANPPFKSEYIDTHGPRTDAFGNVPAVCKLAFNTYNASQASYLAGLKYNNDSITYVQFNMSAVDLAFMATITSTVGSNREATFSKWYRYLPHIIASTPPDSVTGAIGRTSYDWAEFYDSITHLHVIFVSSFARGTSFMRFVDAYGGAIAYQMAGAFAPFINAFPDDVKTDFVSGAGFLKGWYQAGPTDDEGPLVNYLNNLTTNFKGHPILLAGTGYNGAVARAVGMRMGIPSFVLNSPGTRWTRSRLGASYTSAPDMHHTINADCDVWQQLDRLGGDVTVHSINSVKSGLDGAMNPLCSQPHMMVRSILQLCGDPTVGRTINSGL